MKKLIFLALLISVNCTFAHKYYVSIADLAYDEKEARIEGTLKITAHDFERALADKFDQKIELETIKDDSEIGKYMQYYLAQHFKIYSENQLAKPNYIGKEITNRQELYLYFTFTQIKNPAAIKVINTLLFELFAAQQNIVHYRYKEQTKSVTLVPSKTTEKITFD